MAKSLLEQLPDIMREGRREAEKILESLEGKHKINLQTRELVIPNKDTAQASMFGRNNSQPIITFDAAQGDLLPAVQPSLANVIGGNSAVEQAAPWRNRLIYGDNLLAMAALLAGDETTPSLRGRVDLIYIDPPFDSKAD
jgi:adenine-specific DNA-methyltransferase